MLGVFPLTFPGICEVRGFTGEAKVNFWISQIPCSARVLPELEQGM